MKKTKHEKILENKEKEKRKHLERIATQMLKQDEQNEKMKSYKLKQNPLDLF
jgi:hypothetical protein|tara:strand:- start:206 stop:361 length:156 start_codon:yes stop_codon:yes gene_type:complete